MSTIANPSCPECGAAVAADATERGLLLNEILPCADCGAELEVTGLEPLTFDLAPEIEEDWGE